MNIQKISIEKLNGAKYNPRKDLQPADPEYVKLKKSIEHYGYVDPIIVNNRDSMYIVVGGHQRLKVLKDLGYDSVECVVVKLSDTEEKALNIALNKINGDWDAEKLEDLLRDISIDDNFDIELTGFDLDEVNTLFSGSLDELNDSKYTNATEVEDDNFDIEKAEQSDDDNKRNIKIGDMYKLGDHILLCGDSLNKDTVHNFINGYNIDVLITDPPYDQNMINTYSCGANYLRKIQRRPCEQTLKTFKDIQDLSFFDLSQLQFYNDLPVGSMYIFNTDTGMKKLLNLFDDYNFRILTWTKIDPTPFMIKCYMNDIEYCLYLYNNNKHKRIWNNGLRPASIYHRNFTSSKLQGMKDAGEKLHPTMKPIELISRYIQVSSSEGGYVLDLFGGSGTTLIACEKLKRKCLMMELNIKYCNIIIDRWEAVSNKKAELITNVEAGDINERDAEDGADV